MHTDQETASETHSLDERRSLDSEQLHAAFARAGLCEQEELPQPELGDQVGRYTVLSHLGQGGMGVVYKAYDRQLDRNVALKLLRRATRDDEHSSELRLLREAQMLAQLQHPNVVAVYDAGLSEHGVFIAMELVRGQTLRGWLAKRPRTVPEILAVFQAAGQGLAAAHEAGFVHRDFKPSNVLVAEDGSVRVLDFGVASLMGSEELTSAGGREVVRPRRGSLSLPSADVPLTEAGTLIGTPAFMAPEQIAGGKATQRSEQFAFCVCLHLALYGCSPVNGDTFEDRRWNLSRKQVLDVQMLLRGRTHGRVPARVRKALRRGLSVSPADRFESMHALLEAIREPPRRWSLWAATATLGLGFGVGSVAFHVEPDPCLEPVVALGQVWNDPARTTMRSAFERSGHAQAGALYERVEQQLDDYAEAWAQMYGESCRATFVNRVQSERLHDQRLSCLERRRSRMRAVVEALGRVEGPEQLAAHTLLPFQLPRIADCADLEAVGEAVPLPTDPELRAQVLAIRQGIDEVETLRGAGQFQPGLARARELVGQARGLGSSVVLAEALGALGSLEASGGSAVEAQAALEASILEAAKVGDDVTAAKSWTWLIYALVQQRRLDLGRARELAAWAAVERADLDEVRGWLLNNLGALYGVDGELEQALDHLSRAIEIKQRTLGRDHVDVGISWFNLGTVLVDHQRFADARMPLLRARAVFERTVGPAHPLTIHAIGGLCQVEAAQGNHEAAIELCGQVIQHYAHSPSSQVTMARNHFVMTRSLWSLGRRQDARVHAMLALQMARAEDPALSRELERWLDRIERELALEPPVPTEP